MKKNRVSQYQLLVGVEGIKVGYGLALQQQKLDVICLSDQYEKVVGTFLDTVVAPRLYGTSITLRELLPSIPGNISSEKKDTATNKRRFLDSTTAVQTDCLVGEDLVVLVSFTVAVPTAIVISDAELVKSFQVYFDELWQKAKE